ncbi:MAG: ABC transporter ATP-binding protein [Planctomycetes bacterium]|nr:ABC transporter ATP-binding protein [Planctomycetota bacterium]
MKSVLSVLDLTVEFDTPAGRVRAVDGVSFELAPGETLALVGESGSGKTLTALALLGLLPHGARVSTGRAFFGEQNLLRLSERELRKLRGRALAIVFQDPLGALHPMLTIERQLTEVIQAHEGGPRRAARARALVALEEVGLAEPERVLGSHAHELSGGMRQRVLIAMAILLRPAVLFADEPTSALDVTVQVQVLALLAELQRRHGIAIVLISHDLARVAEFAERVQVLYAGRTVEVARTRELFARPLHPYTRGLLASAPRLDGALAFPLPSIQGQPSDLMQRPAGCAFHPRCALVQAGCKTRVPELAQVRGLGERRSACFEVQTLLEAKP